MKIALSIVALLLLVGCSEQKEAEQSTKAPVPAPTQEVVATKAEPVAVAAKEVVVKKAEPVAVALKDTPQESVVQKETVTTTPPPTPAVVKKDAAALFRACASCHGADASKAALGKSQVIKGWSAQKIADALHGYKNKTYGGASKAMMQGQVAKLSDEDIKILAEYITKL
jgi:cytochrome c553